MINLAHLRFIAKRALEWERTVGVDHFQSKFDFQVTFKPVTVVSLIDEIERLDEELKKATKRLSE